MRRFPLCFESREQYAEWLEMARVSHPAAGHGFCNDCKAEFKEKMLAERRCEFPEVRFKVTSEGAVEGFRSPKELAALRDEGFGKYYRTLNDYF